MVKIIKTTSIYIKCVKHRFTSKMDKSNESCYNLERIADIIYQLLKLNGFIIVFTQSAKTINQKLYHFTWDVVHEQNVCHSLFLRHQNNYWIEMIEVFGLDGSVISRAVHRSVCKVSKKQKLMNKSSDFWIIDFIELMMLHQDFMIDLQIRIHVALNKWVTQLIHRKRH